MAYIDGTVPLGMLGGIIGGVQLDFQVDMLTGDLAGTTYVGFFEYDPSAVSKLGPDSLVPGQDFYFATQMAGYIVPPSSRHMLDTRAEFMDGQLTGLYFHGGAAIDPLPELDLRISDGAGGAGMFVEYELGGDQPFDSGTGIIRVIPAPSALSLLATAAFMGARRRR